MTGTSLETDRQQLAFVHIGHHKCGSSYFQIEVIPKIHALHQPEWLPGGTSSIHRQLMYLIRCDDLYFDLEQCREDLLSRMDGVNCLSHEGFCGHGTLEVGAGAHVAQVARRLRAIFGPTRVLIVIRNQKTMLPSFYKDDIKFGYACGYDTWIQRRLLYCQLNGFRYFPMIDTYIQEFGKQNVKVHLFEELFRRETIARILEEMEIDAAGIDDIDFGRRQNVAYSKLSLRAALFLNQHFGSKVNARPGRVYRMFRRSGSRRLDVLSQRLGIGPPRLSFPGYDEILHDLYHEDNARVSEAIGRDLHAAGYV